MFPANYKQFQSFLSSKLTKQLFIETWLNVNGKSQLVCLAVTDVLLNGLSAVYTFYHPDYKAYGLGVFSILTQINLCKELGFPLAPELLRKEVLDNLEALSNKGSESKKGKKSKQSTKSKKGEK